MSENQVVGSHKTVFNRTLFAMRTVQDDIVIETESKNNGETLITRAKTGSMETSPVWQKVKPYYVLLLIYGLILIMGMLFRLFN